MQGSGQEIISFTQRVQATERHIMDDRNEWQSANNNMGFDGQPGAQAAAGQGQQKPAGPLSIVALVLAIAALLLCWVPVAGLLLAVGAEVLAIVARSKSGNSGGVFIGAIVVGALAAFIGLGSTACGLLFAKGASDLSKDMKASGVDMNGLLETMKDASDTSSGRTKSGAALEKSRARVLASMATFREKYRKAVGRDFALDMDTIRQRVNTMNGDELSSMQVQLLTLNLPGIDDEQMIMVLGDDLVQRLTPKGSISIQEAPKDSSEEAAEASLAAQEENNAPANANDSAAQDDAPSAELE